MKCILCDIEIVGRPAETTEGPMCGDAAGCRRRAWRKFVAQDENCTCGSTLHGYHKFGCQVFVRR